MPPTLQAEVGDRIISMDGEPTLAWLDVVRMLKASPAKTLALVIERDGKRQDSAQGRDRHRNGVVWVSGVGGPRIRTVFMTV